MRACRLSLPARRLMLIVGAFGAIGIPGCAATAVPCAGEACDPSSCVGTEAECASLEDAVRKYFDGDLELANEVPFRSAAVADAFVRVRTSPSALAAYLGQVSGGANA